MQVYLATLESTKFLKTMPDNYFKFGLVSYYYLKDNTERLEFILTKCKYILVDSGAHSFQHGKKVDLEQYTQKYINFIKRWTDNPNMIGFFEMDVDNVIGYDKVKLYREQLEAVSDKIIPVWHKNRGIDDFIAMCEEYKGKRVSITGFGGTGDILDSQYNLFINKAHQLGCNIHILGMTRFELLQTLNLHKNDSFDSSTWRMNSVFGNVATVSSKSDFHRIYSLSGLRTIYNDALITNFCAFNKLQKIYDKIDKSIYFK